MKMCLVCTGFTLRAIPLSAQDRPEHGVIGTTVVQEVIEDPDARIQSSLLKWNIVPGVAKR